MVDISVQAYLKGELAKLGEAILNGSDIRADEVLSKHADWVDLWRGNYEITEDNVSDIIRKEVGVVFAHVLEDAGVYKCTDKGREDFMRFIESVS